MRYTLLAVACLACAALGDKPSSGYGAPAAVPPQPQVKYGGPIVYSAEKPPIIHFPPPPRQVIAQKSIFLRGAHLSKGSSSHRRKCVQLQTPFSGIFVMLFHRVWSILLIAVSECPHRWRDPIFISYMYCRTWLELATTEPNGSYHLKEHQKLYQKVVSDVASIFVGRIWKMWGECQFWK